MSNSTTTRNVSSSMRFNNNGNQMMQFATNKPAAQGSSSTRPTQIDGATRPTQYANNTVSQTASRRGFYNNNFNTSNTSSMNGNEIRQLPVNTTSPSTSKPTATSIASSRPSPPTGLSPNGNNMRYISSIDQIIPRLYISDDIAARNRRILDDNKITHILNLTTNIPNKFQPDIVYMKLVILDFENQNIEQYFDDAFHFIDNALKDPRNSVLVHCNAGISRSASFVIAYLMLKQMYTKYRDAHDYVKQRRPIICPNRGFEKQLLHLESRVKRKVICLLM